MLEKKNLLGVGVTNASEKEILEYITKNLEKEHKKFFIVTPNPEILVYASKHKEFKTILNRAELALSDGVGLVMASKFLGKRLKSRVTGVDLMESLCKEVNEKPITVGFLGAGLGVAEKTSECLKLKYPGLKVAFVGEEWLIKESVRGPVASFPPTPVKQANSFVRSASAPASLSSSDAVRAVGSPSTGATPHSKIRVNQFSNPCKSVDILFVAFGFPKQEEWIAKNLDHLPVKVAIGVGGAFDYISGRVKRAPKIVQQFGFEWLYRLIMQPWRIKRQLALVEFVYLVVREKFLNTNPSGMINPN